MGNKLGKNIRSIEKDSKFLPLTFVSIRWNEICLFSVAKYFLFYTESTKRMPERFYEG